MFYSLSLEGEKKLSFLEKFKIKFTKISKSQKN